MVVSVLLQSFVRAGRAGGGNNLPQSYWWTKKSVSAPTNAIERERERETKNQPKRTKKTNGFVDGRAEPMEEDKKSKQNTFPRK